MLNGGNAGRLGASHAQCFSHLALVNPLLDQFNLSFGQGPVAKTGGIRKAGSLELIFCRLALLEWREG